MNIPKFNLTSLEMSDLICNEPQISIGGTITTPFGYVFKLISINSAAKEAVVELFYLGDSVELRLMKYNDTFSLIDPSNSERKFDLTLKSVFEGGELNIANFSGCHYTKQYSNLVMTSDLPLSVVDGQSYTVAGILTKDKLNESLKTLITNEKVYLTESGTNVSVSTTNSNGEFELPFTYHENNNYEIYYPGTIDVTSNIKMLNATTAEGATHILAVTFNEELPDYAITAFNTVSNPVESVVQILTDKGTINDLIGWQLKDIQINKKQLIVYLKDTNTLHLSNQLKLSNLSNLSNLSTIKTLNIWDELTDILAYAVVGATLGMLLGAIFPLAEPFTFTAGLILGVLVGIFSKWDVIMRCLSSLPGCVSGILGSFKNEPTTDEVNENAKEFLDVKLKECTDVYNSSPKDSDSCILYSECMKNTYANFQEYTQGYLFQKVSTSLTLNAKNLKSAIDIKCINRFKAGEISCEDLISCTTTEGNDFISQGDTIIYQTYPKDDPYIAPWEKNGDNNLFGNLILYGGLALVGYIGYKAISKKN